MRHCPDNQSMKVLYVEDNPQDIDLTSRELRRTSPDIHLEMVDTVAAALARLDDLEAAVARGEPPCVDLLLLDMNLPDGNGLAVLAEVRHRSLPLAVVVLTGSGDEESVLTALRAGADDYLAKRQEYWTHLPSTLRSALAKFRSLVVRHARPIRLLCVEPHEQEIHLTRLHLAAHAPFIHLDVVRTAEQALERLPQFGPVANVDVVLIDYRLPGMSALDALKEILDVRGLDVPVILTASEGSEDVALQALKLGVADYIVKSPGYHHRLSLAVENVFYRVQSAREHAALRESERRFSDMLGNVRLVSLMLDTNGRITYCNDYLLRLTGWQREEVVGQDWFELFIPPDLDATRGVFADLLANRPQAWHRENHVLTRSGEQRLIRWNNTLLRSPSGAVVGTASIGEDITENKKIEEEIRYARNFLTSIFDNIPNSIFVKDAQELRFVRVNAACEKLTGYLEKELLGKSDYDFFPREQADFFIAKDRETIANNEQVFIVEEEITSKDGTTKTLRTKKFPIVDQKGSPQYLLGMSEDITEAKRAEQRLRESESKYRGLIEQASDGITLSDTDGKFIMANTRACELLGCTQSELLDMNRAQTYFEQDSAMFARHMELVRSGETLRIERSVRRKDGSALPAEISIKMLDNGLVQVIFHDVTHRRAQEQKIARLSRIQAMLSGINSAIVRIRNRQELFSEACRIAVEHGGFTLGWIARLDPASATLVPVAQAGLPVDLGAGGSGYDRPVGLVPMGAAELALRERRPAFDNNIAIALSVMPSGRPDTFSVRQAAVRLGAKSAIVLPLYVEGETFGVLTLYAPERDFFDEEELKLLTELAGDISFGLEFIAKEEKVDYLAYYDVLTGLPNRSLLFDRLGHQFVAAKRDRTGVALVLIDLDRFRLVNETLGRQAGDALLEAVAKRLNDAIRGQDTVARVGPNRFALAVSGVSNSADVARALETRSEALFAQPFVLGQEEFRVLATSGVAMFPGDGDDPESLFANAEAALRKAKAENLRFLFYSPEINARVADSLRLENKLRRALEEGELVLWYQPKVSVATRKLTGFEALMRWQDPESGMVPPIKFIPIMEQTGLILEAGRWALSQAARDYKRWTMAGTRSLRIAVNVSPLQLRQKDFVSTVIVAVDEMADAGGALDLEITESTIMESIEAIIPKLQTISGLGVETYIDDFGTGYSSLAYIARLPIHSLKVDRSFVVGMTQNQDSLNIVRSVISMAHALRLHVVAEGVETEDQAALLQQLECDEMQGYLFSRPVPPDEVPELVKKLS